MSRLTQASLTLASVLLLCGPTHGQTEKPCYLMFENLSRETFIIQTVSVLQADGNKQAFAGRWTFKPGTRTYLLDDKKPLNGRQVYYTIELPDGVKTPTRSTTKKPLALESFNRPPWNLDVDCILQTWNDDDLAELRKDDKSRKLSKAETTYRYWNTVHGIQLEESIDVLQNGGLLAGPSLVSSYFRTMANRIEDLETSRVDEDAVAAAKAYAAFLRGVVKMVNGRGGKALAALGELSQRKVDTLTKMFDEEQMTAGKAEDVFQFMRSRRKALEKRYELPFPHFVPPVEVTLVPFALSKGFYVSVLNASGDDLRHVQIRYRDAKGRVKLQSMTKRLVFSPAGVFAPTRVDPSDIKWTVAAGEWITLLYEGGAYSYPTSKLLKR